MKKYTNKILIALLVLSFLITFLGTKYIVDKTINALEEISIEYSQE